MARWRGSPLKQALERGRLLQSNRDTAMARNFSCSTWNVLCSAQIAGPIILSLVGTTDLFGDLQTSFCRSTSISICSGDHVGTPQAESYSWFSQLLRLRRCLRRIRTRLHKLWVSRWVLRLSPGNSRSLQQNGESKQSRNLSRCAFRTWNEGRQRYIVVRKV